MKKVLIAFAALALVACGEQKANQHEHSTQEAKVINVKLSDLESKEDPICGMALEEGAIADTMLVSGKTYGYCNPHCKEEHKSSLEK